MEYVLAIPANKTILDIKQYGIHFRRIDSTFNALCKYNYLAFYYKANNSWVFDTIYKKKAIIVVKKGANGNIIDDTTTVGNFDQYQNVAPNLTSDQKNYIQTILNQAKEPIAFVLLKKLFSGYWKIFFNGNGNGPTTPMRYPLEDIESNPYPESELKSEGQKKRELKSEGQKKRELKSEGQKGKGGNDGNPQPVSHPLNQILFGPPGTGKTYNTVNMALDIVCPLAGGLKWETKSREEARRKYQEMLPDGRIDNPRIVFITFHQSMSYEDFIEGIKPEPTEDGKITYEVKDGIFKKLCEKAKKDESQNYVMIIDEINRGNVANIFGELISLIEDDKRLGASEELHAELPYSHTIFGVPKNVYIIGTMNTADRSVEALDSALRRRFTFKEMMPKSELVPEENYVRNIFEIINQRIEVLKDREHQIGHSYFMDVENEDDLKDVFYDKIIPLLQEYFYGDYEKIQLVLGEGFVKKDSASVKFAGDKSGDFDVSEVYRIVPKDKCNMDEARGKLLNKASEAVDE